MAELKSAPWIVSLCLGVLLHAPVATAADNTSPVARWDFGTEEETLLGAKGNVQRDQAGPRPPEFRDLAANNTAVRVDAGAYLSVLDSGSNSNFDFTNGDAITIEAWVNPSALREGQVSYVVGKGRTGSPKFARDNQNWSLRVVGANNEAKLSFLFATKLSSTEAHWHRWDSRLGFPVGTGWHHIAIAYRFGNPQSIRGWVNGEPTQGTWSYGGEFGQRCLLSRRLVERGVRFIAVSHNLNFLNGISWDVHNEGILNQHKLIQELDTAVAALIVDLEAKRMLDKTLIVITTEFGRPPEFDSGGGRGHQGTAFSCVLAGGGLSHCGAWGETDEVAKKILSNPISVPDFFATTCAAVGIDYHKNLFDGDRPVPITDMGQPIEELFT